MRGVCITPAARRGAGFAIGLACVSLAWGGVWWMGGLMVRNVGRQRGLERSAVTKPPAVDLGLVASDGTAIAATYTPGRTPHSPAVLLLHGIGESRAALARHASWLASLGYASLRLDFRGHGGSERVACSFGLREAREARAGFDWLRAHQGGAAIAVIGISLGGAAALLGPDGPLPAEAMVLQGVYPGARQTIRNRIAEWLGRPLAWLAEPWVSFQSRLRFGAWPQAYATLPALPRLRGAVLVIGGLDDSAVLASETMQIFDAAPEPKQLWLVPGDHMAICRLWGEAYRSRVGAFIGSVLGAPEAGEGA
ncbi:pimeloyl-ACP methyl ester carboxylesterase [Endobacter medicaginis]|uniref:Pimeloyl-ACP methyl ester carboxylesterase n=4 Tax=Endobacter medicaginis TaxID=1181271 RepID=A0A839V401_9PROT|nr:alpha/beta fold hydrolase [Endobacter medicaginis]MBB3174259.1 pimeloyl-ACP methyl ester carboxylesterase [Endobacter medicaginis]MCX5474303.1 alpha/beta fold hydrolase [Endobacter medicaginis]